MECLAHILSGACKAGVQSIRSDNGEFDTELTRQNMQKYNLDEEDPEGGAVSKGGTDSLQDQGEASSHTCFDPFCIPDPLLQVSAGK